MCSPFSVSTASQMLGGKTLSDEVPKVVIGICSAAAVVIFLILIWLWVISRRRKKRSLSLVQKTPSGIPIVSREIKEIRDEQQRIKEPTSNPIPVTDQNSEQGPGDHRVFLDTVPILSAETHRVPEPTLLMMPEVSPMGWGNWFTVKELEDATNGFADENVIGEGGYGIVYRGLLKDSTHVAVKNLLNNRGQAEREFKVEVEAVGRVRHKNLVRLLGYCAEGNHRMLVYEFVNNGNLEQWLHGDVGTYSPLTWEIRMHIIRGTAKGLAYLHEGLEPKVVHRDIKSSNILLDRQWNPKVSDFGLAKLIASEKSYITTRVMGTFGYVAPEYASTGMLNESSDVYSFGVLIMEIISGRNPVDYSRPPGEANLIDWLKTLVSNRNSEGVVDPKLLEKPSSRSLKRTLLVALRCIDPNAQKRPRMGNVVHMLETDEFSFHREHRSGRENGKRPASESGDSSGYESSVQTGRQEISEVQ